MVQSVFNMPLAKLREYSRGERITAAKLNEGVKEDNRLRGLRPGRQKRPEAGGPPISGSGAAAPIPRQEYRLLPMSDTDGGTKDIVYAAEYFAGTDTESNFRWSIILPWQLRRTPFEYDPVTQTEFRGLYRYHYQTHFERICTVNPHDPGDPDNSETQVIVPELWVPSSYTNREQVEVIRAGLVLITPPGETMTRKGVIFNIEDLEGDHTIIGTLYMNTGEGETLPSRETWAILEASRKGARKRGQIQSQAATTAVYRVEYHDDLLPEPGSHSTEIEINLSWSYRLEMESDRQWAVKHEA